MVLAFHAKLIANTVGLMLVPALFANKDMASMAAYVSPVQIITALIVQPIILFVFSVRVGWELIMIHAQFVSNRFAHNVILMLVIAHIVKQVMRQLLEIVIHA